MIKTHNIAVDNYSITPETIDVGTKGSYGNEQLNLTLSKQWDDLIVKISFFPPNHVPMVVIYSGEPIPIPAESTRNGGTTQYMISGHTSGRVIKSLIGRLNVLNTLDTATTPPNSPTPTEMEQVYDWMREAVDMANSVRQDADSGLFNGEDGVNGIDGVDGTDGKSAYESAVDGGYPDTEQKFNTDLAEVSINADKAEASANRAGEYKNKIVNMDVTAETLAPEQPATVEITETESNIEMVTAIPSLQKIWDADLAMKTHYWVKRMFDKINAELKHFNDSNDKIREKYRNKNITDKVVIAETNIEQYNKEYNDLLDVEIEIDFVKPLISDDENIKLSMTDINMLENFIDFVFTEDLNINNKNGKEEE